MKPTLAEILKQRIAEWPGSWRQLAATAGVHHPALTYFMQGRRGLTLDTVDKLLPVLGIAVKAPKSRRPKAAAGSIVDPECVRLGAALRAARQIAERRPARRRRGR